MKLKIRKIGDFIQQTDVRNTDLAVNLLLGVSIDKKFIESHANTVGTDFSNYKIVKKGQFAYCPVTSRNGNKISIARLEEADECLISSSYIPFEIVSDDLDGEYLTLLFMNSEFDRYARFNSWGSAREVFSWDDFCDTEIKVPDLETQKKIVNQYKSFNAEINKLEKQIEGLNKLSSTLYRRFFIDFDSSVELKESTKNGMIPACWKEGKLTELMSYSGGQQPPASEFIYRPKENYIRLVQIRDYETDQYATFIPIRKINKLCTEEDIMIARYGVSLGRICCGLEGAYNVALAKVTPIKNIYREYLRCFLSSDYFYEEINGLGERSAQQGFNQNNMESFIIPIAPDCVYEEFNKYILPVFREKLTLTKIIKKLKDAKEIFLSSL